MAIDRFVLGSAAALVMTALAGAPARADNLILNGGFETGDFSAWTLDGNLGSTYVGDGPNAPHTGAYAAQLGAVGSDNSLSQAVADVVGQVYALSFWHIYAPNAGPTGDFAVQWNGTTIYGPIASTSPPSPQVWTKYSFAVTGTGLDKVTFLSRNDPDYQGLDDVALSAPEPATWAILGLGFLGLGVAAGVRRTCAVAA